MIEPDVVHAAFVQAAVVEERFDAHDRVETFAALGVVERLHGRHLADHARQLATVVQTQMHALILRQAQGERFQASDFGVVDVHLWRDPCHGITPART